MSHCASPLSVAVREEESADNDATGILKRVMVASVVIQACQEWAVRSRPTSSISPITFKTRPRRISSRLLQDFPGTFGRNGA